MASEPILGCIYMFAGNFAPNGYAYCNGQLLAISQNTALFSLLGTTYGGDGRTTFALPDLRGRAPISLGQGPGLPNYDLGEVVGAPSVTLTVNQLPAHSHSVQASQAANTTNPSGSVPANDSRNAVNIYASAPDGTIMNQQMIGSTGGSQPIATQSPSLAIGFIIATQGIYPSRP